MRLIAVHSRSDRDRIRGARRRSGAPDRHVVVPCYNERPNVAPMIAKLDAALRGIAWEVIYVDDNSPDGTAAEVRRIAQTDPRVRCIRRIGRRGLASAVIEGALSSSAQLRRGDRRRPAARRDPPAGDAGGAADRPVRPRRRQPARRGRRQRRARQPLAARAVGWRHPAGAVLPAGAAHRSDERLLHAAAPAVRGAGRATSPARASRSCSTSCSARPRRCG